MTNHPAPLSTEQLDELERLRAENKRLRERLEEVKREKTAQGHRIFVAEVRAVEISDERDALLSEVRQLRADAERYRWLCDPSCSTEEEVAVAFHVLTEWASEKHDIDAVIDDALNQGGK